MDRTFAVMMIVVLTAPTEAFATEQEETVQASAGDTPHREIVARTMMITGVSMFAVSYAVNVLFSLVGFGLLALLVPLDQSAKWVGYGVASVIPVFGVLGTGALLLGSSNDLAAAAFIDGALQAAGLTMLIYGLVTHRRDVVPAVTLSKETSLRFNLGVTSATLAVDF